MTTNEPWVSVEEVVKPLGEAWGFVSRWSEPRGLPAHKVGLLWKFERSQVDTSADAGGAESDDAKGSTR